MIRRLIAPPALPIVVATLITLSAVASTWSAYQSARWSGVQARNFAEASGNRAVAIQNTAVATTRVTIDAGLFAQWLTADADNNRAAAAALEGRFPKTLGVAFGAWRAAGGPNSPTAPASPFELAQYVVPESRTAENLNREADARFQEGLTANQQSDDYVLMTVIFATIIVIDAVGKEFASLGIRRASVILGASGLLAGGMVLATFPVH